MGNALWPGDNTEREVAFLKPHGVISLRWLAIMRTLICLYFLGQLSLNLSLVYETFYLYLTNWALASCALTYSLMAIAHCVNKDFKKESYEEVEPLSRKSCPFDMWQLVTALYEWTLSIQVTVTLAFWFIEIPAMGLRGDFNKLDWINWAALVYNHTVPILVCFAEWRVSAIPIGWRRYPFYILVGILYLVTMIVSE